MAGESEGYSNSANKNQPQNATALNGEC